MFNFEFDFSGKMSVHLGLNKNIFKSHQCLKFKSLKMNSNNFELIII